MNWYTRITQNLGVIPDFITHYEADDIKDAFRGDKEMLGALKGYAEQHDVEEEYEEYEEDEDQDEDW